MPPQSSLILGSCQVMAIILPSKTQALGSRDLARLLVHGATVRERPSCV